MGPRCRIPERRPPAVCPPPPARRPSAWASWANGPYGPRWPHWPHGPYGPHGTVTVYGSHRPMKQLFWSHWPMATFGTIISSRIIICVPSVFEACHKTPHRSPGCITTSEEHGILRRIQCDQCQDPEITNWTKVPGTDTNQHISKTISKSLGLWTWFMGLNLTLILWRIWPLIHNPERYPSWDKKDKRRSGWFHYWAVSVRNFRLVPNAWYYKGNVLKLD